MHVPIKTLFIAALLVAVPALVHCGGGDSAEAGDDTQNLTQSMFGNFKSVECERVDGATFQIREYHFSTTGVSATWTRFSDASCVESSKLMTIALSGSAKATSFSKAVSGAGNITVFIDHKTITPTASGVAILERACGKHAWAEGKAQVVTTGCGKLLQQEDDCPAEFDLIKLTMSGLFFGDRAHPLCSEKTRPTKLSQFAVKMEH